MKKMIIAVMFLLMQVSAGFSEEGFMGMFKKKKSSEVLAGVQSFDTCFILAPNIGWDISSKLPKDVQISYFGNIGILEFKDFGMSKMVLDEIRNRYKISPYFICTKDKALIKIFIQNTSEYKSWLTKINQLVSEIKWGVSNLAFSNERFSLDREKLNKSVDEMIMCLEKNLGTTFTFHTHEKSQYRAIHILPLLQELNSAVFQISKECKIDEMIRGMDLIKYHDKGK